MIGILWFLSIFLSQFYIFPSGIPQPSHWIICLIFLFYILKYKFSIPLKKSHKNNNKILSLLIVYICVVDFFWSLYLQDVQFLVSLIYWIFSIFIYFFTLKALDNNTNIAFFKSAIFIGVLFLAIAFILGLGRFKFIPRYNGFFNDPNQMAYWVLCCFGIFYFILKDFSYRILLLLCIVSLFVILTSFSRSAMLGFTFVLIGVGLKFFREGKNKFYILIFMCISITAILIIFLNLYGTDLFLYAYERFISSDFTKEADDRGYYRIINFPEYILFGAGQGLDYRFDSSNEIHSTFNAILFYYGIIGFLIFGIIILKIFIRLDVIGKFIFLGPLGYGLSTYGARTPIFWIFIASAVYHGGKEQSAIKNLSAYRLKEIVNN